METVMVTLKHAKAKKLLQDLEEMDLITVTENPPAFIRSGTKISDLKKLLKEPMTNEQIDQQLAQLRAE